MSEVRFYDGRPVFCDATSLDTRGKDRNKLVTRFYHITPRRTLQCLGKVVWTEEPGIVMGFKLKKGTTTYAAKYEELGPMTYGRAVQIFATICEELIHREGPQ